VRNLGADLGGAKPKEGGGEIFPRLGGGGGKRDPAPRGFCSHPGAPKKQKKTGAIFLSGGDFREKKFCFRTGRGAGNHFKI